MRSTRFTSLAALSAVALFAVSATRPAHAQATFTFSGGSGSPLTATLVTPVTYTITSGFTTVPIFLFDAVGGSFGVRSGSSSITYQVNGGAAITFNSIGNNFTGGVITADDAYLFASASSATFNVGDVLTLSSGTFTTSANIGGARPANGTFTTFITDDTGGPSRRSNNGVAGATVAAPEPGSIALVAANIVWCVGVVRRRRRNAL